MSYDAQQCGAVTATADLFLGFDALADGQGLLDAYQWTVRYGPLAHSFVLASPPEEYRHLGSWDQKGAVRQATEILREAVDTSNRMLARLVEGDGREISLPKVPRPNEHEVALAMRDRLNAAFGHTWGCADTVQFLCDWMAANDVDPDGGFEKAGESSCSHGLDAAADGP